MNIPLRAYWRLLNRYLISQGGAPLLMSVLLLANTGLNLATPQIERSFIDAALAGTPAALLIRTAIGFILIELTRRAFSVFYHYKVAQVSWTAANALRIDLMAHLVRLDLGFHKTHSPGELISRVDGDVDSLGFFLSDLLIGLIGGAFLLCGILVAVLIEDARLGALFCVFALFSLIFLTWVQRFAPPHWKAERECSAGFWGFLGEMLTAIEDIQSCGAVQHVLSLFVKHLRKWYPIKIHASLWGGIWMVTAVVYILGTALAWGVGSPMVRTGKLSLGTLYMVGHYLQMLIWGPIEAIQWQLEGLQHAQVSIARVQELLNTSPYLQDGTLDLPSGAPSIEMENVWFAYQDDERSEPAEQRSCAKERGHEDDPPGSGFVLRGVSFQLKAGRVLGLLGRTGSGKTTVTRLLFRWYDPQKGEIRLGDVNLRQARIDALRARVGLVTQDVQLFKASLRDNLTFFHPTVADEILINTLNELGLAEWLSRLPGGLDAPISSEILSAGEAQLVALARIFLKNPDLVILDEASSRIDPATEVLLGRVMDKLLQGRSAVIVAHHLQTVERADDILILENGQVIEKGPRQWLAANPDSHFARLLHTGIEDVLI